MICGVSAFSLCCLFTALSLCPSVPRAAIQASGHARSSVLTATPNSTVLRHAKPSSHRNQPPWVAATHSPATCHSVSGIAAHPAFPTCFCLGVEIPSSAPAYVLSFLPACLHPVSLLRLCAQSIFRFPVLLLIEMCATGLGTTLMYVHFESSILCWLIQRVLQTSPRTPCPEGWQLGQAQ